MRKNILCITFCSFEYCTISYIIVLCIFYQLTHLKYFFIVDIWGVAAENHEKLVVFYKFKTAIKYFK